MISLREFVLNNDRFIIAHRGASFTMIENTMPAFQRAIEFGAKVIEVDIQVSNDGVPYAYHDINLMNIGFDRDITKLSSSEISKINLNPNGDTTKIPQLLEILHFAKEKEIYLVIEIKLDEKNRISEREVDIILTTISAEHFEEHCLFASFNTDVISYIKSKSETHNIAAIAMPDSTPKQLYETVKFDAFICSMEQLNAQIVDECRGLGVYLGVYSADDEEQLGRILKFGINAIVTNYPERISKLLATRDNG